MIVLIAEGKREEVLRITPRLPLNAIVDYDGDLSNIVKKGKNWTNYVIANNNQTVDIGDFLKDDNGNWIFVED